MESGNPSVGYGNCIEYPGRFVAIGMIPQTEAVKNLVALDESGYIKAGEDGVTSVPGFSWQVT